MNNSNRSFGITFAIFFIVIFAYRLIFLNKFNYSILIFSLLFLILGILNSKYLTIPNKIWVRLGLFLGNIISPIVMYFIYFLAIFPVKILLLIFKKDIIDIHKNKNNISYWRISEKKNISNMDNQF